MTSVSTALGGPAVTPPGGELDDLAAIVHAHAVARPDAPALVAPDRTLSYAELDAAGDALAAVLRSAGVRPGAVVPLLLPPSVDLVVSALAVLRAGAAHAALDHTWPAGRLERVVAQLPGQVAITGPGPVPQLPDRIVLTDRAAGRIDVEVSAPPVPIVDPAAAMVFFTSGSTGEPKAVLSPDRATARLFLGPTFAPFDHDTAMAHLSAVAWDAFALEVWGPLCCGGTCVLHTDRPITPSALRALVRRGANTVFLTTSLFHLLVDEDPDVFAGLRTVLVGGEKLSAAHADRMRARWPDIRLVNGYGPAECAVFVLTHTVGPAGGGDAGEVPLGRPVPRTAVLVLRDGVPVPDGEVGELCAAGDGLALGYLDDPELTASRFVTVDVAGTPTRVYRTGDLGVVGPDGLVHFRGRLDRQLKRRGHRIEPAGLERTATGLPGVARCAAVPRLDDNGNCVELLLCYVATPGADTGPDTVTAGLARSLPTQSMPDRVLALPRFPLSANGKLDVSALLALLPAPVATGAEPVTGTERAVAAEVRALLAGAPVDRDSPLPTLGLTSLAAIRLAGRLGARFDRVVPISRLLGAATVEGVAGWLDAEAAVAVAEPDPRRAPLAPMQHGFVFRHLALGPDGENRENHCLLSWTITGSLAPDRLAAAVAAVHTRHGYLSGRYHCDDQAWVEPSGRPVAFERHDGDAALLLDRLHAPFDLAAGLVWRAVLVRTPADWRFGVAVHHAAFDGWSQHLLADELSAAYTGTTPAAPPSPARTAAVLAAATGAADLAGQRAFWQRELAGVTDLVWPDTTPQRLDGPDWIEVDAPSVSLAPLLRAAHTAVAEHTGQLDFAVGVPVNRRGPEELRAPIGCLIDTVCVRLRPDGTEPADALAHADLPFADVLRLVRPKRSHRHPVYQVIVALQDSPPPDLRLPGCAITAHPRHDAPWSRTELVLELFRHERRLRVTRNSTVVPAATAAAIARSVADGLSA